MKNQQICGGLKYKGKITEDHQYITVGKPSYKLSLTKLSENNYSMDTINDIPCWSAEALLEILPDEIYVDEEEDTGYLTILKEDDTYIVSYDSKQRIDEELVFVESMGEDLADVLFKIVEWLLTNKLL